MAAPVVIGPNSASVIPTADQYKLLIEMVKINPQLFWYNQEPNMFLSGLESVLELSPILHTHWITFMLMMIPGSYELERLWVRTNIISPLLSWNAAKAAFIGHFQRGDYLDGRRLLYTQCTQSPQETTQEYARRFQTLATQLGYADNDNQSLYRFIDGLHRDIQQKMLSHKLNMRTVGGIPGWEFTSLSAVIQLATQLGTDAIYIHPTNGEAMLLPLHLRSSVFANPVDTTTSTITRSTINNKRKLLPHDQAGSFTSIAETKCYRCQCYGHFTYECPTKVKRARRAMSFRSVKYE